MRYIFPVFFTYLQLTILSYVPNRGLFLNFEQEKNNYNLDNSSKLMKNLHNSVQHKIYLDVYSMRKEKSVYNSIPKQIILDQYGKLQGVITKKTSIHNLKTSIQFNNYLLSKIIKSAFLCIQFHDY